MNVTLSESELSIARWLAGQRYDSNRNAGVVDRRVVQGDIDFEGICGELAFCKLMNVYPDMTIKVQSHTFDCIINGARIDVKTSKYETAKLTATLTHKVEDSDVYVLMIGENGTYRCAGYCFTWALINPDSIVNMGYNDTYGLEQWDLLPIERILEYA